jgi:hypothetical protein
MLQQMPRPRISATSSSARRSCWCPPHCTPGKEGQAAEADRQQMSGVWQGLGRSC